MNWAKEQRKLREMKQRHADQEVQKLEAAGWVRLSSQLVVDRQSYCAAAPGALLRALRDLGSLRREPTRINGFATEQEYWTEERMVEKAEVMLRTSDKWEDLACARMLEELRDNRVWLTSSMNFSPLTVTFDPLERALFYGAEGTHQMQRLERELLVHDQAVFTILSKELGAFPSQVGEASIVQDDVRKVRVIDPVLLGLGDVGACAPLEASVGAHDLPDLAARGVDRVDLILESYVAENDEVDAIDDPT